MPHDALTLLNDIRRAVQFVLEHTQDRTLAEYEADPVLSAAVERYFITTGEALARLARVDARIAANLGDYPQIIAFRNVVVHGYDIIENVIVWGVIKNEIPGLLAATQEAISTLERAP